MCKNITVAKKIRTTKFTNHFFFQNRLVWLFGIVALVVRMFGTFYEETYISFMIVTKLLAASYVLDFVKGSKSFLKLKHCWSFLDLLFKPLPLLG